MNHDKAMIDFCYEIATKYVYMKDGQYESDCGKYILKKLYIPDEIEFCQPNNTVSVNKLTGVVYLNNNLSNNSDFNDRFIALLWGFNRSGSASDTEADLKAIEIARSYEKPLSSKECLKAFNRMFYEIIDISQNENRMNAIIAMIACAIKLAHAAPSRYMGSIKLSIP